MLCFLAVDGGNGWIGKIKSSPGLAVAVLVEKLDWLSEPTVALRQGIESDRLCSGCRTKHGFEYESIDERHWMRGAPLELFIDMGNRLLLYVPCCTVGETADTLGRLRYLKCCCFPSKPLFLSFSC